MKKIDNSNDLRFKHSPEVVAEIRRRNDTGESKASISREMNIPLATVKKICYRKTRREV